MSTSDVSLLTAPPTLRLDGRVAWITGASRGLGRAIAFALAGVGAEVVLTARSAHGLDEVAMAIREHGGVAETVVGSVGDHDVIARSVELIDDRWGRLDVLINNAGISPVFVPAERIQQAEWSAVLSVNLSAPLACCSAALPLLERAREASVINISSIHGSRAHQRLVAYAVSKAGLEMVTRTLAVEWALRGIRVNAVAPGYIETEMSSGLTEHPRWGESLRARIPMARFGTAAEVVPVVLLLASKGSSYITGSTVYVDGGWTAT